MRIRSLFISAILVSVCLISVIKPTAAEELPITGIPVAGMQSFDRIITSLISKWQIPGAAVAVAKDGRLVLSRGYGWANVELKYPVQPDSLFRIGSISKQITSVAVLRLMEEGRLNLDTPAFSLLDGLKPREGVSLDPRVKKITIRHLLQHSSGLSENLPDKKAIQALGGQIPPSTEIYVRYALGFPLEFDPGTSFEYCNRGYDVLGLIIEKLTGQKYEQYVKAEILGPMGITGMRIGRTLPAGRAQGEVWYYDYPGAPPAPQCLPNETGPQPWPYSGWQNIEGIPACGGWIGSPIDLVRFTMSIDGRRQSAFLKPETLRLMVSRPEGLWIGNTYGYRWKGTYYYTLGWFVRPVESDADWWHTGSMPGTTAIHVRTYNGLNWAIVLNSRPKDIEAFRYELNDALWQAASEVTEWPTHDLFTAVRPSNSV